MGDFGAAYDFQVDEKWQNYPYFTKGFHENPAHCEQAEHHAKHTIGIWHHYLLKETSDMDKLITVIKKMKD